LSQNKLRSLPEVWYWKWWYSAVKKSFSLVFYCRFSQDVAICYHRERGSVGESVGMSLSSLA